MFEPEENGEPFEIEVKDYTNGYHLLDEDLITKRKQILDNIRFLVTQLEKIDVVYKQGHEYMSVEEVRDYMRLDAIDKDMRIPPQIPYIKIGGIGKVYERKDIDAWMKSKRKS